MPAYLTRADVNPATIQQAADELGIQSPIRSWDVEGGQLLLRIATGNTVTWTPPESRIGANPDVLPDGKGARLPLLKERADSPARGARAPDKQRASDYETMLKRELKALATRRGLRPLSSWRKRHLIAALREQDHYRSLEEKDAE
ncbi:MAG: hypothetical protein R3272_13695 [Candidatus Promineifilaceae bacterium]|nr:hypothetical protein [Candidatus Promineifilaceae bacterium]